ncbi:MAG: dihydroneopterin aldolase [Lentisphaerae bacterium]|nr:MAG: dihydroneopterin aldolase [Lentisphaerota bacterium]
MAWIRICDLQLECVLGVYDWEHSGKRLLRADIEIECDITAAARSDDITRAVDYTVVAEKARAVAGARPYFLLESMGYEIMRAIFDLDGVVRVRVVLDKPACIPYAEGVRLTLDSAQDLA